MKAADIFSLIQVGLEESVQKFSGQETSGSDQKARSSLADAIRYSLLAPGKRIRARLTLACSEMLGVDSRAAMSAALALEMIHCFTLIHDDLPCLDNDDFRRGKPTNHKVYGEAIALLAGDALISQAWDAFLEATEWVPLERWKAGLKQLNHAIGVRGVIGGQAAELSLQASSSIEDLKKVHQMKTGALFNASLLIPAEFSGVPEGTPQRKALIDFGLRFGEAFQAADDLDDREAVHQPTSVLYYVSAETVRSEASQKLTDSFSPLRNAWGSRAEPLFKIAEEIVESLTRSAAHA